MSVEAENNEADRATHAVEPGAATADLLRPPKALPLRSVAMSAGDQRVAVMREVHRVLSENDGDRLRAAKVGLDRLHRQRLLTAHESRQLARACAHVVAAQEKEVDPDLAFARVRLIYDGLLLDDATSPVALAIASVASSGTITPPAEELNLPEGAVARISRSDKVDMGIVGGAIIGAGIGGAIGGVGGAVIGAAVGGIAGGIGAAC